MSHRSTQTDDVATIHNITINNKKVAEAIADTIRYDNSTLFHTCNLKPSDVVAFNYSLNTIIDEITPKISIIFLK